MNVLEFVHCLELHYVQSVWKDAIWLSFQQMFAFVGSDMRNGREDVRAVRRGTLDAIAVVDPAFACFVIDIEILQVVVKINGARAEITSKQCCVGRKNSRNIDVSFAAQRNGKSSLPLMEMCDDSLRELMRHILQ